MTSSDFDLPGPIVLERGDVARIAGAPAGLDRDRGIVLIERASTRAGRLDAIAYAIQSGAIASETGAALIAEMDPTPGLVTCSTCGTDQARREMGGPAVHFATRESIRPCVGSWPAKVKR